MAVRECLATSVGSENSRELSVAPCLEYQSAHREGHDACRGLEEMGSGVPGSHVSTQGIKLSVLEWAGLRKPREGTWSNLLTHTASAGHFSPPTRQEGSQHFGGHQRTYLCLETVVVGKEV